MHHLILRSITGHELIKSDDVPGEKRTGLRTPTSLRVHLKTSESRSSSIPVLVRNLSQEGIGLLGDVTLKAGTEFIVEFPRTGAAPYSVVYRAVRCTRVPGQDRLRSLGGRYVGMLAAPAKGASAKRGSRS